MTNAPRVPFLITSMTVVAAAAVLRRLQLRWGATAAEASELLPGDELVSGPDVTATRAITIHAGVGEVWPWIVQLGQRRAASTATTRLVVRERYAYIRWWARLMVEPLTVVSFLMSQRMLRGIRDRAEQSSRRSESKP